jgi:hypothetical protein
MTTKECLMKMVILINCRNEFKYEQIFVLQQTEFQF